ncbi:type VI toxin-antitoxin system SocB family DNA replication inhibitor toxin [Neorhizobium sp. LjRoot104]|uniref:type VI toxin-antitoxin system SocB family DNA replication inhibitor toxin n=1 Tax=Neorhizobium sp. LjRoot104 TaxID=3342254 RepID=UPI003ECE0737
MTIPLLPDTDLARIAPLPAEMKRNALWQMKTGFSTFSYKPVRACFSDIFNIQPGMFAAPETPFEKVKDRLMRACKQGDEFRNNEQIAKALHEYAKDSGISGRHHDFFPLAMGIGRKVSFWLPMVLAIDEKPFAIFIDPRRSRGLTELGRRFVFSMMHERIRAADADFAEVNLGIVRFVDNDENGRSVQTYSDAGVDLYSLDELEMMVAETYRIWQEVHEERVAETRRKTSSGGKGFI